MKKSHEQYLQLKIKCFDFGIPKQDIMGVFFQKECRLKSYDKVKETHDVCTRIVQKKEMRAPPTG